MLGNSTSSRRAILEIYRISGNSDVLFPAFLAGRAIYLGIYFGAKLPLVSNARVPSENNIGNSRAGFASRVPTPFVTRDFFRLETIYSGIYFAAKRPLASNARETYGNNIASSRVET